MTIALGISLMKACERMVKALDRQEINEERNATIRRDWENKVKNDRQKIIEKTKRNKRKNEKEERRALVWGKRLWMVIKEGRIMQKADPPLRKICWMNPKEKVANTFTVEIWKGTDMPASGNMMASYFLSTNNKVECIWFNKKTVKEKWESIVYFWLLSILLSNKNRVFYS